MRRTEFKLSAGFTLMELLLAASIFAILAVSLYTAFSTGLLAHLRGEKDFSVYQNARLVLNKIAVDFQNALYTSDLGLGGTASEVYFFILPEPADAGKQILPRRVTYAARKKGDAVSLFREEIPYSSKLEEEKPQPGKGREIGAGLRAAAFEYFREAPAEEQESLLSLPGSLEKVYEWVSKWKSSEGFPLGIRIVLEYPEEKFERRIPSPLRFHQVEEEAPAEAGGVKR